MNSIKDRLAAELEEARARLEREVDLLTQEFDLPVTFVGDENHPERAADNAALAPIASAFEEIMQAVIDPNLVIAHRGFINRGGGGRTFPACRLIFTYGKPADYAILSAFTFWTVKYCGEIHVFGHRRESREKPYELNEYLLGRRVRQEFFGSAEEVADVALKITADYLAKVQPAKTHPVDKVTPIWLAPTKR